MKKTNKTKTEKVPSKSGSSESWKETPELLIQYKIEADSARKDFANLADEFLKMKEELNQHLAMLQNALILTSRETDELTASDITYNIDMVKRVMSKRYDDAKKRVEKK